jgi:hypothetical protein
LWCYNVKVLIGSSSEHLAWAARHFMQQYDIPKRPQPQRVERIELFSGNCAMHSLHRKIRFLSHSTQAKPERERGQNHTF